MEKIWLKKYPKGVPAEIKLNQYASLLDIFQEACFKYKSQACFTNMGTTLSFDELEILSNQFASFLQNELKLKKGDRIALQMPNILQYPIALFGALKAGLIVVNTNPLYTPREMEHQFKDAKIHAIVILANFASQLEGYAKNHPELKIVVTEIGDLFSILKRSIVNWAVKHIKKMVPKFHFEKSYSFRDALKLGEYNEYRETVLTQSDIAFLQYTGGTTGVSKGAVLTHGNIIANVEAAVEWMSPKFIQGKEVIVTALPLYHIFSLTVNCLLLMRYGGHNILITNPRDISDFIKTLRKTPFTILTGVNTLFNALMNHPDFKKIDFSRVKLNVAGAMALQTPVAERWLKMTGGSQILEGYGLTEASPIVCCNPVDGTSQLGTVGVPFPSTEVVLRDDHGQDVSLGSPGEICVRGPQVMKEYWNRPEETAAIIRNGWLHTGDIGVMQEDGFFKIVDRKKDMILISGFNVYPNEIEEVVSSHPGVLEVAAVGVLNEKSGEVVKIFVVKKDQNLTEKDLIDFCKTQLTAYKIPKLVEFKTELPKTNVGKILRRALKENS